jgi:hypothetical protein
MVKTKTKKKDVEDFEEDDEDFEEEEEEEVKTKPAKTSKQNLKVYTKDELKKYYQGQLELIEQEEIKEKFAAEYPELKEKVEELLEFKKQMEVAFPQIQKYIQEMHPIIQELITKKK